MLEIELRMLTFLICSFSFRMRSPFKVFLVLSRLSILVSEKIEGCFLWGLLKKKMSERKV